MSFLEELIRRITKLSIRGIRREITTAQVEILPNSSVRAVIMKRIILLKAAFSIQTFQTMLCLYVNMGLNYKLT